MSAAAPSEGTIAQADRVAEFRKLALLAGLPLSKEITEALLEALAANVTPTGLATVVAALLKKQVAAGAYAAAAADRGLPAEALAGIRQ